MFWKIKNKIVFLDFAYMKEDSKEYMVQQYLKSLGLVIKYTNDNM